MKHLQTFDEFINEKLDFMPEIREGKLKKFIDLHGKDSIKLSDLTISKSDLQDILDDADIPNDNPWVFTQQHIGNSLKELDKILSNIFIDYAKFKDPKFKNVIIFPEAYY